MSLKPKKTSRDVWEALAQWHRDFGSELYWIGRMSLVSRMAYLRGDKAEFPPETPDYLAVIRGLAEGRVTVGPGEVSDAEWEWLVLLDCFKTLCKRHEELASACDRLADAVRPGRPRKRVTGTPNSQFALAARLQGLPSTGKKKVGRKQRVPISNEQLLKLATALQGRAGLTTTRGVAKAISERLLEPNPGQPLAGWRQTKQRDELTKYLEKRLSDLKFRKSLKKE